MIVCEKCRKNASLAAQGLLPFRCIISFQSSRWGWDGGKIEGKAPFSSTTSELSRALSSAKNGHGSRDKKQQEDGRMTVGEKMERGKKDDRVFWWRMAEFIATELGLCVETRRSKEEVKRPTKCNKVEWFETCGRSYFYTCLAMVYRDY